MRSSQTNWVRQWEHPALSFFSVVFSAVSACDLVVLQFARYGAHGWGRFHAAVHQVGVGPGLYRLWLSV